MSDKDIHNQVREAFDDRHKAEPPSFEEVWDAAELQHRRNRRRYATFSGIAAALAIVAVGFLSSKQTDFDHEFMIADALLNKTHWAAPTDVLLPQHQYDIYREVPFLVEPTNTDEGLFL